MAIQLRRGAYSDFNASKMKAGEVAVVLSGNPNVSDGKSMHIAFGTNDVKRITMAGEPGTQQNSATVPGYVTAPGSNNSNKVWKTDLNGVPGWMNEQEIDTNKVPIDTSASASTIDGELYAILVSLDWASDVISS